MSRSLLSVAVVAVLASSAFAELKPGDVPAPLGSDARFVMGDEVTLEQLRGKVVAIQLAHTSSKPTAAQVPKIHELLEKHGDGFVFLWLFEESKGDVEAFAKKAGAKFPVVAGLRDQRKRYGLVKGFPTTYVLDLEGKVAWAGNFVDKADQKIISLLKGVKDVPWLPASLSGATILLEEKKFGAARRMLLAAKNPPEGEPRPSADDLGRIDAALQWMEDLAQELAAKADAKRDAGDHYGAFKAYKEIGDLHPGSDAAANAQSALDALLADKKIKREIDAWIFYDESFEAAQKVELTDPKKAIKLLKKVATKYRGTAAAEKAKYWVERLEDK